MIKRIFFILTITLFSALQGIMAQPGYDETKWALGASGSVFLNPLLSEHTGPEGPGRGFRDFTVWGEYYLPYKWNVHAGYFRTEVSYGIGERSMEGLHMGVKKFFINPDFPLQPYLSVSPRINWGRHRQISLYEYPEESFRYQQYTRNPRLAVMTGAGVEMYIFSSVAFVMEYTIGMGIDSRTYLEYSDRGRNGRMADHGLYHNLSLGVKLTFPFRFTKDDGMNLLESMIDIFFDGVDRKINSY